jgi:putative phage-type endonuclease
MNSHITPENEAEWIALRKQDITSTEVSALFGLSPYKTRLQLWAEKRGELEDNFEGNTRTKWGTMMQAAIANAIAEEQGWTVRARNMYSRIPALQIGASFDYEVIGHEDGPAILEIKNVDWLVYKNKWTEVDGIISAPDHIELQLQHQMLVSKRTWGAIGVLVGGNDLKVIIRQADPEIHAAIKARAAEFWASVSLGVRPDPNFPSDAETVIRLNKTSTPGTVCDCTGDTVVDELVANYKHVSNEIASLEDIKTTIKAKLLERIGSAEKAFGTGWSISAKETAPVQVPASIRSGFRAFRVTVKK